MNHNFNKLVEWTKSTYPELFKLLFTNKMPEGVKFVEERYWSNSDNLNTIAIFEGKIQVERVHEYLTQLQNKLKGRRGVKLFEDEVLAFNYSKLEEISESKWKEDVYFPAFKRIYNNVGTDEHLQIIKDRFTLYEKHRTSGLFKMEEK